MDKKQDPRRWPRDVKSSGVYGPGSDRNFRGASASAGREEGAWESIGNFFGIGPKGYRRSDDRLYDDVCETLERHSGVDASDIEVSVKDGTATLTGTVPHREMKRTAERCLDHIPGLRDVQNALRIASPNSTLATSTAVPDHSQNLTKPEKIQ